MTQIEIRRVSGMDYFTQARAIAGYAFRATPRPPRDPAQDERDLPFLEKVRAYVVFADGTPVATATLFPMTQTVRGKVLAMSGVGGVATMPAARRQGHARRLFAELFASMRDSHEDLTALYPFRESFYERLGYAAMPQAKYARFSPATLGPVTRLEKHGHVEQVMMRDGFDDWRAYLERKQPHVHGMALHDLSVNLHEPHTNQAWLALARDEANRVIGGMSFTISGYMETMEVPAFCYDSPEARLLLLDWFARHVDQVKEIKVRLGVGEVPDLWFPDLYMRITNHDVFFTSPMGRVLNVPALAGMDVGPGEITIDVIDTQCPWVGGTWALASDNGKLTVAATTGTPAATLTIQGLSALVYAGQDPAEFRIRGWGDPDAAAQATLRSLFPQAYPYLHEDF